MSQPPRPTDPLTTETVATANAEKGTWVHLIRAGEGDLQPAPPKALCGVTVTRPGVAWFALNGCRKCCTYGLKRGLTTIIDTDGRSVALQDVLDGVVRED